MDKQVQWISRSGISALVTSQNYQISCCFFKYEKSCRSKKIGNFAILQPFILNFGNVAGNKSFVEKKEIVKARLDYNNFESHEKMYKILCVD